MAERSGFELSVPLVLVRKRPIFATFFSPLGNPIESAALFQGFVRISNLGLLPTRCLVFLPFQIQLSLPARRGMPCGASFLQKRL